MASSHQNAAAMSNDAEHHAAPHAAAAAAPYPIGAAALPEPMNFAVGPPTEEVWEAPLFARIETITANEEEAATVSTENILAWSKPQFKGLTVYFAPDYKPSDENSWGAYCVRVRLRNFLCGVIGIRCKCLYSRQVAHLLTFIHLSLIPTSANFCMCSWSMRSELAKGGK